MLPSSRLLLSGPSFLGGTGGTGEREETRAVSRELCMEPTRGGDNNKPLISGDFFTALLYFLLV